MKKQCKFVVSFSGGICSYFAAKLTIERYGATNIVLLFADTNYEDADLYRFLGESSAKLGVPITRIADGHTPWDIFFDERFIGNSRVDLCSRILKRELLDKWCNAHCDRSTTRLVVGLSSSEGARYIRWRARMRARGWKVEAPAMATNWGKDEMLRRLLLDGLEPPALYEEGFAHNNCGGRCVKAGQASWRLLLMKRRASYLEVEEKESAFCQMMGKTHTILKDRRGGISKPMTLRSFRERIECGEITSMPTDQGGCGCAID